METKGNQVTGCKVDRIARKYGFPHLDKRMLYRRENADASLRDLDEYVAQRILSRSMEEAGIASDAAEHYLQRLRSSNKSERQEARRTLECGGVPIDEVCEDFISYQTIRKHLNECLGTDTSPSNDAPSLNEKADQIGRLKSRFRQVTERNLSRLEEFDAIQIGEPEAVVTVTIRCGSCGDRFGLEDVLGDSPSCSCGEYAINESTEPPE